MTEEKLQIEETISSRKASQDTPISSAQSNSQSQPNQPSAQQQQPKIVQHDINPSPTPPKQYSLTSKIILYICCIIPPAPVVFVSTEERDIYMNFILFFLFGVGALFHSIYIVYKYTSGSGSYDAWVKKNGDTVEV